MPFNIEGVAKIARLAKNVLKVLLDLEPTDDETPQAPQAQVEYLPAAAPVQAAPPIYPAA